MKEVTLYKRLLGGGANDSESSNSQIHLISVNVLQLAPVLVQGYSALLGAPQTLSAVVVALKLRFPTIAPKHTDITLPQYPPFRTENLLNIFIVC